MINSEESEAVEEIELAEGNNNAAVQEGEVCYVQEDK